MRAADLDAKSAIPDNKSYQEWHLINNVIGNRSRRAAMTPSGRPSNGRFSVPKQTLRLYENGFGSANLDDVCFLTAFSRYSTQCPRSIILLDNIWPKN
jgi:hypothetical protein